MELDMENEDGGTLVREPGNRAWRHLQYGHNPFCGGLGIRKHLPRVRASNKTTRYAMTTWEKKYCGSVGEA